MVIEGHVGGVSPQGAPLSCGADPRIGAQRAERAGQGAVAGAQLASLHPGAAAAGAGGQRRRHREGAAAGATDTPAQPTAVREHTSCEREYRPVVIYSELEMTAEGDHVVAYRFDETLTSSAPS